MTDDERLSDPCAAACHLPRGSLVVLRSRERARRIALAAALAKIARGNGLFLLVADDPALAASAGADGVHFPEAGARRIGYWRARRPDWFLTAAAHSLHAAVRAAHIGADAVFLSPVFATASHPGRAPLGPLRLRQIAGLVSAPVYALGGVDALSARRLSGAPLAGFAMIGALNPRRRYT